MIKYEKIESDLGLFSIKRIDESNVETYIPIDPSNSDYQRYLKWLENPEAESTTPTL